VAYLIGIEREGLRVTADGKLASSPHPAVFGDKLANPHITVDYAEQQVEIITTPQPSAQEAYDATLALSRVVQLELRKTGELWWPSSRPPEDIVAEQIELACFADDVPGCAARAYREMLCAQYGSHTQLFSGVHFNISFADADTEFYLRLARNVTCYGWLLTYLFGAAPDPCNPHSISQRQGEGGYRNTTPLAPSYASIEAYCASVEQMVADGQLRELRELYTPVRLKPLNQSDWFGSLRRDGVAYVEIRLLDLDPFDEAGIALETLEFLVAFTRWCAETPCDTFDDDLHQAALENIRLVADHGLDPALTFTCDGIVATPAAHAERLLAQIDAGVDVGDNFPAVHALRDTDMLELATAHQERAYETRWLLPGFEGWELSTQILAKEALKRGIGVKPLDRADNLIVLEKPPSPQQPDACSEYVMQATRTSADSYIVPLLMNNKTVSKQILAKHDICVPVGEELTREILDAVDSPLQRWVGIPAVVKPKSTNFGIAVTMFERGATVEELHAAVLTALEHDTIALIETYVPGTEYRFLVIDGEVRGVLHRKPANVVGDGTHTIAELVSRKNEHPYRSRGYCDPLITIELDDAACSYLARAGYTPQSVPDVGVEVLLRPNSNISTGGDSIDVTDEMPQRFKDIATCAAAAFGAVFCGVDMIIEDMQNADSPYAVIEVNWNPAIHIHAFPAVGTEREIAPAILRALKLL